MRDGTLYNRNLDNILLAILYTFCYSILYLICLAETIADMTFLVTDNNDSIETESFAAFNNLGGSVDMNQLFLQV